MNQFPLNYYLKSVIYFVSRHVLRLKYMVGYSSQYDVKFKFRTPDGVGRMIFKKGIYEEELTDYILKNLELKSGDIVFDVGANIGWYSIVLSKYYHGIEVHSFEPDPENFSILKANILKNNFQNIVPNNFGLGKEKDTLKLYLYKKGNLGRHSILKINHGSSINVLISSFDDYLKDKKIDTSKIKFLKIDIEGYEYLAFLGGKEFLNHVQILLAEYSPGYMRKGGLDPAKLIDLLRSYNFSPFRINGMNLEPVDDEQLLKAELNLDLIWKKK